MMEGFGTPGKIRTYDLLLGGERPALGFQLVLRFSLFCFI